MCGLAAVALAQVRGWTHDIRITGGGSRLQRVLEMIRHQWGDRRTGVPVNTKGDSVRPATDRLEFITASGVIYPEWPLVRASYAIEPDRSKGPAHTLWKLVYEESRVTDPGAPPKPVDGARERETEPNEAPREMELLAGATELRWERYSTGHDGEPSLGGSGEQPDAEPGAKPALKTKDRPDPVAGWKKFKEVFEGDVPAMRLCGVVNGEEFSCVLVIGAAGGSR